ncbi:MAG: hypothetical protein ABI051_03570 [Vicinamibacterales bacterium]
MKRAIATVLWIALGFVIAGTGIPNGAVNAERAAPAAAVGLALPRGQAPGRSFPGEAAQSHLAWVDDVLTQMEAMKPGMTRGDLMKVFVAQGGVYSRLHDGFHSRACAYFMVDVQFAEGPTSVGDVQDTITRISRPYLTRASRTD